MCVFHSSYEDPYRLLFPTSSLHWWTAVKGVGEGEDSRYLRRNNDFNYTTNYIFSNGNILSAQGYPYTRDRIVREARIDIPPLLRGKIWAALLGVQVRQICLFLSIKQRALRESI